MKKTKKSKIQHIYDPIFKQNYYFIDCKNHDEFLKICLDELEIDIGKEKRLVDGECYEIIREDIPIQVFWTNKKHIEVVVHECFHAVYSCLSNRGIELSTSSEEIFAYLLQYLIEEIKSGKSWRGQ